MSLFSCLLGYHPPHLGRQLMPWELVERFKLTAVALDRRIVSKKDKVKNIEEPQKKKKVHFFKFAVVQPVH